MVCCISGQDENELLIASDAQAATVPVSLDVTIDEVFCGIGNGRSVARRLGYEIVSAIDSDAQKVNLYNATCLTGEVRADGVSVESGRAPQRNYFALCYCFL